MAVIRKANDGRYLFWCPGCERPHAFNKAWEFNSDLEKPTISPSLLVKGTRPITDDEHDRIMNGEKIKPEKFVCHSFIKEGKIQFLSDCTHDLAGQTVELNEF